LLTLGFAARSFIAEVMCFFFGGVCGGFAIREAWSDEARAAMAKSIRLGDGLSAH
jgi:hypothetical protein